MVSIHQWGNMSATSKILNAPIGSWRKLTNTSTNIYPRALTYRKIIGRMIIISQRKIGFASLCSFSKEFKRLIVSWRASAASASICRCDSGLFIRSQIRYLSHLPKRWRAAIVSKIQYSTVAPVTIELATRQRICSTREGKTKYHPIRWKEANAEVKQIEKIFQTSRYPGIGHLESVVRAFRGRQTINQRTPWRRSHKWRIVWRRSREACGGKV